MHNPAGSDITLKDRSVDIDSDWAGGYVTEVGYTHGYYRELSPAFLQLILRHRKVAARAGRPPRRLELGFGQGVSLAVHAATCPGEWWGADINPSHVVHARELIDAAGVKATVLDSSFAELARRDDLPEFDLITVHGVWSWISDDNRRAIVELIRRKLAVGGVLYLSYNCLPGWANLMPLRQLMTEYLDLAGGSETALVRRIDQAIDYAQRLADTGCGHFRTNPQAVERLKQLVGQNRNYLAHEYFNRNLTPMTFSEVERQLAGAKLSYAGSAIPLADIELSSLPPAAQQLVAEAQHPTLRETVRDYLTNQAFRKDIFVKGRRDMSDIERIELLRGQRFVLTATGSIPLSIKTPSGQLQLKEEVYRPILAALAAQNGVPKPLSALPAHCDWGANTANLMIQSVMMLVGIGAIAPAQSEEDIAAALPRTQALNRYLLQRARGGDEIGVLASPVTGAGILVPRISQLFLLAHSRGATTPEAWAHFAWSELEAHGQRLAKDGKVVESPDDNLAELKRQASEFGTSLLPLLKALMVA